MNAKPITAESRWQTWCLYGPSGVGKTTLAATALKPFICDSNQGLLSIADVPGLEHVRGDEIHSMTDLDEVYDNCTGTGKRDWSKKFSTIVFDHFDDIQGIIMDGLAEKAAEKDDRRDPDDMQQKEYGTMGNKLRRYLRKFKKVPMHKILICSETQDYETGQMRPQLIGAMKSQLPFYCDHVIYMRERKGRRYLHLDSSDKWFAKTRARWLKPEQRKFGPIDVEDTEALTKIFSTIAAGRTTRRSSKQSQ